MACFLECTQSSVNLFLLMSRFHFLQHSESLSKSVSTKIPLIGPRPKNCCNIISCVSLIVHLVFSDSYASLKWLTTSAICLLLLTELFFFHVPPYSRKNGEKDVLSDGTDREVEEMARCGRRPGRDLQFRRGRRRRRTR